MLVAQPLQDGQGRSSSTPLKSYACEVEGYQSIDIAVSHGKSNAERRQLSHYASRAYELATRAFAWLLLILLLLTLASHSFTFSSTAAHAGSAPEQAASPLVLGASTLPSVESKVSKERSNLWKRMQARHWVPSVAPSSFVAPAEQQPVCEDADPLECTRIFAAEAQQVSANSSGLTPLPSSCSPQGNGIAAARCPKSCGLCAVVLADCHHVAVFNEGSCVEGSDVVGEVCAGDGDMKKEAYCTWLPTNTTTTQPASGNNRLNIAALTAPAPRRFVCAHCADVQMSPERRAMMAQMLELRIEEDGREASRSQEALENNAASVAERDAVVVHR